jgi:glycosyltransferase involved in cell wall biosynthesis
MASALPRIAFVDLTFNWPPEGGCWVDLKEVIAGLAKRGFPVKLFTPLYTQYYPRGRIEAPLPFEIEQIPFSRFTYNAFHLRKRFGKAVGNWKPDIVFLGDGYHLKPHLLDLFSREYPTFCRFYAYDVNCLNLHYWLYGENRICDGGFLTDPKRCHRCWHPGRSFPKRLIKLGLGRPDHHPQLHFTQEYANSLAFTKWYQERLPEWLARAEGLIVYNEFIADFFRPYSDKVQIVPSGVDTARFHPSERGESGSSEVPVILVPGRINDELKGFSTVREACEKLRSQGHRFDLRITAAHGMTTPEEWITDLGWTPQDKVPNLYRSADIVIVPSLWVEPFGITTLEAMASGLPVVGSRIGGIAETLVDGVTGIHYSPGNASELAAALEKVLTSPSLRETYGKAGRARAVECYDWEVLVDRHYAEPFSKYPARATTPVP